MLIALVAIGGLEALIYIVNLNQTKIFLQVAFLLFCYLMFKVVFLYDLHVKQPGSFIRAKIKHANVTHTVSRWLKIFGSACGDRWFHFRKWEHVSQWLNYLLLPAFIFWSSVIIFYVNLGNTHVQQTVAVLTCVAVTLDYWFLKEAFLRGKEVIDNDIFVALSMVKVYAATVMFGAALAIFRYYCFNPFYFSTAVFAFTFLLIHQSLFRLKFDTSKNILIALLISWVLGIIAQFVYVWWGLNYFTAAILLAVCYNLMWGVFHYFLDKALTWRAFSEILIISLIIVGMVVSVTNFKARILGDCEYYLNY